jgi:transcription-repair coupling factor (superfamily II helicase)
VHRAHVLAALRAVTGRPVVAVCADELEAGRFARDLETLTTEDACALFARDFTFYNAEGVSRELEQRRLHTLYQMARGNAPVTVASPGGLMQRAIPREALLSSAMTLHMNKSYDLAEIAQRLVTAGYSRAEQVEGRGQFALRGGILDFFSPAYEMPVRCEFFGDELDSMGFFDTSTQRRTSPADSAVILPSAETLPQLCGGGASGLTALLETARTRVKKSARAEALAHNISADMERLADGRAFPAADKYMELIYPMATAADFLPDNAIVFISEPARVKERAEWYAMQVAEECAALLEAGVLDSSLTRFSESWEGLTARLESFPVVMADSFTASGYPWRPRALYSCLTKQLPSYGGSLETAAGDIAHYEKSEYRTVVTCADRRRADALCEYLSGRGVKAAADYALARLPEPGTCAVTVGALSAGMEYPNIKLAVITEGQLLQTAAPRRKKAKTKTNRERVQSFTD